MDPVAKLFSLSSKLENLSDDKEKAISGYGYYDWGKSAFETSVTVAILPVWYTYLFLEANGLTTSIGSTPMTADAVWSLVLAISTLSVAIVSPSFGVIADRRLIKKKWLKILTYVGAGATFLLAFAPLLGNASWIWLMVMFLLANVGLNGAGVFYNALLPHLGKEDEMDDISNRAFAYGYLGGGLLLVVHIGLILGVEADWVIPFCMATAGLWWYGFALFTFMWVPEPPIENEMEKLRFREAARFAVGEVKQTLKDYKAFPTLFLYMLAYFFFIDGINTVTALGGVYGVSVLGIGAFGLMLTILAIQFIAAPFAIIFTKIADRIGTKRALFISIAGWVVLCFAALAFAPLELESHEDYDILYEWNESEERYTVHVSWSTHEDKKLAQKVDYEDEEFDEQAWAKEWSYLLPTKNSENQKLDTLEWAGGETEDEPNTVPLDGVANDNISSFLASVDDTRFSASVDGGGLDGTASVGVDHPTSLGDGSLDFIPIWARSNIWEPLGLTVFLQFMILGCLMGTLLGGSQGLARSIFGQIVPKTRSTEFFGFFGFFNKVAAFMGPTLYFFMTVVYDSRVGIFSIAMLLLIGAGLLYMVDIEAGRADARAEDERLRKKLLDPQDSDSSVE
uniref:Major facilitator permease superfamily protein (UMF1) n=1 Tax=uncultured marine group II/III euryarchaeote SAT1000_17_E06 TaxID=1456561 RepID=A0A075IA74_9EURY|nr:major facilitator permease superfamily protein (UMF1) [uncultured marine group II/III euryarchaeote SAT1000_17_E06]